MQRPKTKPQDELRHWISELADQVGSHTKSADVIAKGLAAEVDR
jgi:hypothetical protein